MYCVIQVLNFFKFYKLSLLQVSYSIFVKKTTNSIIIIVFLLLINIQVESMPM